MTLLFELLLRFLPMQHGDPAHVSCDYVVLIRKGIPVWAESCPSLHLTVQK